MDRRVDGEAPGLEARIEALALERRQQAESLRPFDANAWLGGPAGFPLARERQPAAGWSRAPVPAPAQLSPGFLGDRGAVLLADRASPAAVPLARGDRLAF